MKKLLMVMFLLAGTVVYANAQTAKKAPAKLAKALIAQLNLTADQQTKVDAIMQTKAKKIDSLVAANGDAKGVKKERKLINTDAEAQITTVLTDEQKKVYADYKEAQKAKTKAKAAATTGNTAPPAK